MTGVWEEDVKPLGPVQLKIVAVPAALRLKFNRAQIGELLVTVGDEGIGLTITAIVPAGLVHPRTVCVTE